MAMWLRALGNLKDGVEERMCDFEFGAGDVKAKQRLLDLLLPRSHSQANPQMAIPMVTSCTPLQSLIKLLNR